MTMFVYLTGCTFSTVHLSRPVMVTGPYLSCYTEVHVSVSFIGCAVGFIVIRLLLI